MWPGEIVTIGITDYAQDQLNDIVYVEFRDPGEAVEAGSSFGEVESVKAASELVQRRWPARSVEVNSALEDEPEVVNADPIRRRLDGQDSRLQPRRARQT